MKIISLKTEAKGSSRIELSDGSLFSFSNCYLPAEINNKFITDPDAANGIEISVTEEKAFRHASACKRAEKAALRLIARAEQCSSGLRRKLEKRGFERACINAVIEQLFDSGLLDDQRFAHFWLESRIRLPRSPRRLLIALCTRGIERDDVETALKHVLDDETEYSLLLRFVKKYLRRKNSQNDDSKLKIKFLLKNEGFSNTVIKMYLEEK